MREFISRAKSIAFLVVAVIIAAAGSTPTPSLPEAACTTEDGEKGACKVFKECYPYLGLAEAEEKTPITNILLDSILESQTSCGEVKSEGHVRTGNDLICCPDIVESKEDVIMLEGESKVPGTLPATNLGGQPDSEVIKNGWLETSNFPGWPRPSKPSPIRNNTGATITGSSPAVPSRSCVSALVVVATPEGQASPPPHAYPFMAALIRVRPQRAQFCGGSLLDSRHVLTAAHCMHGVKGTNDFVVYLGSHNLGKEEKESEEYKVERIYKHARFSMRTLNDDVAIIRLNKDVKLNKYVQPICLTSGTKRYEGGSATLAGWGKTCDKGCGLSNILRHVKMPVLENSECQKKYTNVPPPYAGNTPPIRSGNICAGKQGSDACQGDSGGPLFANEGDQFKQIGIVSWGVGCGAYPGVYTRVTEYKDWINKNLAKP